MRNACFAAGNACFASIIETGEAPELMNNSLNI
jgi:hypothetical protein